MKTVLRISSFVLFCNLLIVVLNSPQNLNAQTYNNRNVTTNYDPQQVAALRNTPMNGFFGLSFTNMVPQNEYFSNLPKSALGLSLYGGYYADPVPIAFGGQIDLLFNGSSEKIISGQWLGPNLHYYDYIDTLSTQSMVIPITVFFRIQPNVLGWVFPYVEVFGGASIFNAAITNKTYYYYLTNAYSDSKTDNKTSATWCYGASVGFMVKIADFIQLPASHTALFVDTKLRYSKGGLTKYYKSNIVDNGGTPTVESIEFNSQTDMVVFLFGFTLAF